MSDHITCPLCFMTSWNMEDVRQGYCGNCHWWTSDPFLKDLPKTFAPRAQAPALPGGVPQDTPLEG